MSVEAIALVLHHSKVSGIDKLVLVGVANHLGDGGAWPRVETLARYAGCSERTVQRSLQRLVEAGELAVHLQAGGTHRTPERYRPNRYDLLLSCPATCDRTAQHNPVQSVWKTGVTPVTPLTGRGDTCDAPRGDTAVSPEPSGNHPPVPTVASTVTTGRARARRDSVESAVAEAREGIRQARTAT